MAQWGVGWRELVLQVQQAADRVGLGMVVAVEIAAKRKKLRMNA
jgi:hypothetical protein